MSVVRSIWIFVGAFAAWYPTDLAVERLHGISGFEEFIAEFCAALLGAHLFSVAVAVWTVEARG